MRAAIRAVIVGGLVLLAAACGKSEAEMQADCQKAITKAATKTNRPDACKELSQKDYDTLLMAWIIDNTVEDMPQEDQDVLDLYDDGHVNGSIPGD
ncbi:hypothetical protein ACIPIC_18330 [Streptomyces collinus]|uniref:hypothetical protein n=1 Tax=Streptomyces collinus TaxID=42684 RepID=UPI0037FA5CAF